VLSVEVTHANFIVFSLIRQGSLEILIYSTRDEHANLFTTDAVARRNGTTDIM